VEPSTSNIFGRLLDGGTLPEGDAQVLFTVLLTGGLAEEEIGAMLAAIASRGPTVDELVGAAWAMRAYATPIVLPQTNLPILDTCGTGGAPKLFNISTIGAIVVAAAAPGRVIVAKHGNRSRTGRGSAEVLEALGVNIHAPPAVQAACVREIGLCFAFAPDHHPAAKHASAVRKKLGFPTIFNLLGPLVNPAGATRQLVGTYSIENAEKLARALARLGTERAMVVSSRDGLDELTTTAANVVFEVVGGQVERSDLDAASFGVARAMLPQLQAHSLEETVSIARSVLAGESGAALDIVALNAAASLRICGVCGSIAEGLPLAREAVVSGRAARVLERFVELSQS
jgi:anthranilate phosphoribosyltransferase